MAATAAVTRSPDEVFAFLADLRNHWRLEPHFLELESMGESGGQVRIRGPLGISRIATTRVVAVEPPSTLRGSAAIGGKTEATVRWRIDPAPTGSTVTVAATVERASHLDRILLALGGRWWMARLFRNAVSRLDATLAKPIS